MKQRFSSLDVKVISQELASEIVNLRVSNVYDLSSRIFLFKLAKPDHRKQLVVDSGFRCHVTEYSRATATAPSIFVTRMRKFLKSRRVTSIQQLGTDRVIDFSFSDGMYHMFLEFFAGGNIIITDREYNILTLFRQVPAGAGEEEMRVGLRYTVTNKQNYNGVPEITTERIKATLEKAKALFAREDGAPKKSKKKNVDVLRKALSQGFPEYPPLLLDHAFAVKGVDSAMPLDQVLQSEELVRDVMGVLEEAQSESRRLSAQQSHRGYIVAKEDSRKESTEKNEDGSEKPSLLYEDFHPFRPRQFEGKPGVTILEFPSMNATVDEYFSSIETQKLESRLTEREEAAKRKLDAVRQEHQKKIGALQDQQDLQVRKAGAIEDNIYRVQEAMDAVNGLIAQGMDWVEMARLIEMEQGRGNPVAKIIKLPLKLYENTITLLLGEAGAEQEEEAEQLFSESESEDEDEDDEEEEVKKAQSAQKAAADAALTVDIDLGLSPWANATQYYDQKKTAAVKEQKTAQSSSKALKSHEKKVQEDLKKGLKNEKQVLRHTRKSFWFEKFLFFISSEGYLVLGGRDAMQSEILYRRYLKKGDIFVYADLDGATPIIVKNTGPNAPIPPSTLSQAGTLCVATSAAWDSKAVMSAWWVNANQISKTAASGGGLLPTGQFEARGEKNFLAPSQLVLGFAVMFQISKESLKNHKIHQFGEVAAEAAVQDVQDGGENEPAAEEQSAPQDEPKEEEREEEKEEEAKPESPEPQEPEEEEHHSESNDEQEQEDPDSVPAANPLQRAPEPSQKATEDDTKEAEEAGSDEEGEHGDDKHKGERTEAAQEGQQESKADDHNGADSDQGERQLSSRERKLLRQGKLPDPKQANGKKQSTPVTRGKKAKAKKAAAKYADQDDEERELALRLLGANKAKASKAASAAETKAKRDQEAIAQKQRRKAQHERAAEAERKRQAALEEGHGEDDYDEETAAAEAADLTWLPALMGTPHPDDEIVAAIPVCAPWQALGRYKYRVKLQPGSVKKGKAVKEILGRWVAEMTVGKVKKEYAEEVGIARADAEKMRAREGELVKGWKDTEIINTVPVGKVRIMTGPGGVGGGGGDKSKGKGGGGGSGGGGNKGGKKKK